MITTAGQMEPAVNQPDENTQPGGRWRGIEDSTKNRLYLIANTPPSEDIEETLIAEAIEDIRTYQGGTRIRVGVEFTAATLAHTRGKPERYGPFIQE